MLSSFVPSAVWPVGARLAECPTWLPQDGMLAWVDIVEPSYNLLDPATGAVERHLMTGKIGSAGPADRRSAVVALETGLWQSRRGQALAPLASPDMAGIHFNDGKCDPAGRFWVGSRASDGSNGGGSLFRFDPDGSVHRIEDGFDVPNGLGWNADGSAFFLIDTVPRLLYRYDFDLETGSLSNRRIVCRFADLPGKPDGLAIDSRDRIWCAMWDGSGVAILSDDGERLGWLPTPCRRPTSCAFGGLDGRTLFVTTASHQLDPTDPDFGAAGSILSFTTDQPGAPVALFGAAARTWR